MERLFGHFSMGFKRELAAIDKKLEEGAEFR